jgi:putative transposase
MNQTDIHLNKALWRFGIISPLLHRRDDDPPLAQMIDALAAKSFLRPDGSPASRSAETLRKWLYRYRHGGIDALHDQSRADTGDQQVPPDLAKAIAELRGDHPYWTLATILEKLLARRLWNGLRPSRATLYRFAAANQLQRQKSLAAAGPCRPFAFTDFGQLWIADFMHGPKLRCGRRFRKAILHAIIDDASRYVVAARFDWHETVQSLMTEMMTAVRRFGICQRFYTDNGPSYASSHLKQVCARLAIHLVHTPPYRPQGRGKVERFFLTVRQQFLSDQHAATIEQLNADFDQYLAEYHQRPHRSLGCSPLQKRLAGENACRQLPEVTDIQMLFAAQRQCRVYNDSTIHLNAQRFEVPGCLPGTSVSVRYLPWDPQWVFYGHHLKPARPLDTAENARRFNHPKGGKP